MKKYSFEKLDVWEKGRQFVKETYRITSQFPVDERFALVQQIRRASTSITSNLAEGSGRISGKEQARYTEMSFGSLMEVLNHLIVAVDLGYISEREVDGQRPLIDEIGNKLNKLREAQLKKDI
ncbi:MAG: four helix bundle protein [Bacteroidetes bacterium]|nr:four helix bundle protein [Bacteroidota bacterium]